MEENTNLNLNDFAFEKAWNDLLDELSGSLKKRPDLQSLLFLIGVQELGQLHRKFSKEEKQDLMHLAVCKLLSSEGYFHLQGVDGDGWPHYEPRKTMPQTARGLNTQELLLKKQILKYFEKTW